MGFNNNLSILFLFSVPFLLVYAIVTLVLGVPLVFLEIGLGQFSEEGTTKIWRALPLFKGIIIIIILTYLSNYNKRTKFV